MSILESSRASALLRGALTLATLCMAHAAAVGQIEFNKLNACADVEATLRQLWSQRTGCRSIRGPVEREIAKSGLPDDRLCPLREPPGEWLSDFKCLRVDVDGNASVTCYRAIPKSALSDYKARFGDHYSKVVTRYFEETKRCRASAGGATQAPGSQVPPVLLAVGEYEFGYIQQLGNPLPGKAAAVHGFATASPALARSGIEALEFVSLYTTQGVAQVRPRTPIGHWRVAVDESNKMESEFARQISRSGVTATLTTVDIDIWREFEAPKYSGPPIAAALTRAVMESFESEGFEALSEEDIRRSTGKSSRELMAQAAKNMPFGARRAIGDFGGAQLKVLMKTRGVACARDGDGAFGAYVIQMGGEKGVADDFGSVGVIVLGLGDCGRRTEVLRRYTTGLVSEAKQAMLERLRR